MQVLAAEAVAADSARMQETAEMAIADPAAEGAVHQAQDSLPATVEAVAMDIAALRHTHEPIRNHHQRGRIKCRRMG